MDNNPDEVSYEENSASKQPNLAHPKVITFKAPSERNQKLLDRYKQGATLKTIAQEFGISEVRVSQIVKKHKDLVMIDREAERTRRWRRLKLCEEKAPKTIAPKDAKELVAIIEAQRKELEGDSSSQAQQITNNTLILNKIDITQLSAEQKWDKVRELMDM